MSSNKKILSILGFLGILAGLLIVNMLFLKVSKSIVEYSKGVQSKILSELVSEKSSELNANAEPMLENKTIQSGNGKEIISNIALYLDNNDKNNIGKNLDSNDILTQNNNDGNVEVKQAAFATTNFLGVESQSANLQEINNQTIKERYPDFPSIDLDPTGESKGEPVNIPIMEKNASGAEVIVEAVNTTIKVNSTNIIQTVNSTVSEITHESKSANATGVIVSEDKTTSVDVLQENKNSTTTVRISENRTIVIDLPNKENNAGKLNSTNAVPAVNLTHNASILEDTKQDQKVNVTTRDEIVVVHKNQTAEAFDNSTAHSEQNITVINKTYSANVSVTEESCDLEGEKEHEESGKEAGQANATNFSHEKHEAEQQDKHKEHNKHHNKHDKHNKGHKHHGKRCRNKKHAHYIELAEDDSTNLIQENESVLDKVSQVNIVEPVDGSSYTQAALSKLIVVDHIQSAKAEKVDSEVLNAESQVAANNPTTKKTASITEKKPNNNADVKKIIRNNKDEEKSSKRISVVASFLSLFVFAGICLLGVEIYKNHQKANFIVIDPIEQVEMEKKYDYVLLDSDLETQNSTREIDIQEI